MQFGVKRVYNHSMINNVRVRIAPSPTGDPHIGTAYTAVFNWAYAKKNKGKFILRIEDTDRTRYVEGSEEKIFESLKWLGLTYDEGPDIGGPFAPYRQSERKEQGIYQKYARELVEKGKAYYCFCPTERLEKVRSEQTKNKQVPRYDKHCRNLDKEEVEKNLAAHIPFVIRLKVPETGETVFQDTIRGEIKFANRDVDDQVLLKSDGFPTYHLAAVVDDNLMQVTHIIRAEEWISSTPKHILLCIAFCWPIPVYTHLPLLRNKDKSKISKRKNPTSLLWYRTQGYLPEALLNFLVLMGWSHPEQKEIFPLKEFIENITLERINAGGPIFDLTKLDWINGEYLRTKTDEELLTLLADFYPKTWPENKVKQVMPLVKERIKKLSEFADYVDFFFEDIKTEAEQTVQKGKTKEETKAILKKVEDVLENDKIWASHDILETHLREFAADNNWTPKDLFMTLRIVLTGKTATPPLFDTMLVLGKEKVLSRLKHQLIP